MKSRTVADFLRPVMEPKKQDSFFEEVPEDFDDGWTEEMILEVAKRILDDINKREGTNYKLEGK